MARLGVTYQDIANAAEEILGQGKHPTIELIRRHLGTGSSTTIATHLKKWRHEQEGTRSVAAKESLPQEFVSLMKGLWQRLEAHAEDQITQAQLSHDQKLHQISQEAEKYKTNNQRWQKMHDAWIRDKDELERNKLGLEEAITSLQTKEATLSEKLNAQSQQIIEKQQRIDELHRLHKQAQENLEHYRESVRSQNLIEKERHAQELQQHVLTINETKNSLELTNKEKQTLKSNLDEIIIEKTMLQNTYEILQKSHTELQTKFKLLEKEQGDAKREAFHWQQQYTLLLQKWDEQNLLLIKEQKQNAVHSQQLLDLQNTLKDLKDQNKLLAHEKWEIAQEKARLEGINKEMRNIMRQKEVA